MLISKKVRISKISLLLSIAIISLLEPPYFTTIIWLHSIFSVLKVVSSLAILFAFFAYHKKLSWMLILIVIYEGLLLISTIVIEGDFYKYFLGCAYLLVFSIMTEFMLESETKLYLSTLSNILVFYLYLNFLSYLLWPEGMYFDDLNWPCYFLGYRNVANSYLIPTVGIAVLNSYVNDEVLKMKAIFPVILALIFNILVWSATGILVFSFFCIGLLALEITKIWDKLGLKMIIVGGMVAFYLIVIVRVQNSFAPFFETVLHRSVTLTGRTGLWDKLLAMFNQSFWLGYGVVGGEKFAEMTGLVWASAAHNQFMQVLIEGGAIALLIFVVMIFMVGVRYDRKKETYKLSVICLTIATFLIAFQAEVYRELYLFFAVLCMAYHVDKLENVLHKNTQ